MTYSMHNFRGASPSDLSTLQARHYYNLYHFRYEPTGDRTLVSHIRVGGRYINYTMYLVCFIDLVYTSLSTIIQSNHGCLFTYSFVSLTGW